MTCSSSEHAEAAVRAARLMVEARRLFFVTAEHKIGFGALHDAERDMEKALDAFARLDERERAREATQKGFDGGG